ncbi:uncharacterized protein HMPREF1541_05037 [Cyphellophora europaea CBS 101466]|uniref:Uncharacterized protein n=1 Tax=Cyphellophora europaea (strain CBS 101466) TaxID=1220924 RepID=W2RWD6_CYPE1|nr:uncharacterized protein HMPREF1541_05037 [Cyphellophora europaea CBS 101466]ETN40757.1 hypothetical protein HMPREF1541_05037 [Cyphellophora europaea CBS 101466]
MAPSQQKRDLADFFKPYARARFLTKQTIPQKRSSPQPNEQVDGASDPQRISPPRPSTPPRRRPQKAVSTPKSPSHSSITTPRSETLAIRTPQSSRILPGLALAPPPTDNRNLEGAPPPEYDATAYSSAGSPSPTPANQRNESTVNPTILPASTQTIVKEGKVIAVRDSDSDDNESLTSLTDIFGWRKDDDETSASSPPELEEKNREAERISTLRLFTNGRSDPIVGKQKIREILAMKASRNMSKYMTQQEAHVKAAGEIKEARERYESHLRELDQEASTGDLVSKLQEYVGADEGEADRLMGAVRRTEALSEEPSFSFFGPKGMIDWALESSAEVDFPAGSVPLNLFRSYDDDGRSRAFMSGFISELANEGVLDDQTLTWAFNALPTEPNYSLRYAYLESLEQGARSWARTNITATDVQACFRAIGAHSSSIDSSTHLEARQHPRQRPPLMPRELISVLEVFIRMSPHMGFEALSMLSSILCRIAIDAYVMADSRIAAKVELLFQGLLGGNLATEAALHVASHMFTDMVANLMDPTLQALLLEHIPPGTPLQCNVRMNLAHAFLLGVTSSSNSSLSFAQPAKVDLPALTTLISTSDDYATAKHRTTLNYTQLRARITILDIAVSNGGIPDAFPTPQFASVKDFNREVDGLAAALRRTTTAIADTGATHMKRTEAKEKLEGVYRRLLYAVRTEPPPKKHIFDQVTGKYGDGDEVRAVGRGRAIMQGFLAKVKEDQVEGKIKEEKFWTPSSGSTQVFEEASERLSEDPT